MRVIRFPHTETTACSSVQCCFPVFKENPLLSRLPLQETDSLLCWENPSLTQFSASRARCPRSQQEDKRRGAQSALPRSGGREASGGEGRRGRAARAVLRFQAGSAGLAVESGTEQRLCSAEMENHNPRRWMEGTVRLL